MLLEQSRQHRTRFLASRKSLAQFFLRFVERCFLVFPHIAKFGQLCLDLLGRCFGIQCFLKCCNFRAGLPSAAVAIASLVGIPGAVTTTATPTAATESAKAHSHARVALGVHDLADEWFELLPIFIALYLNAFAIALHLSLAKLGGIKISLSRRFRSEETNHGCGSSQDQRMMRFVFHFEIWFQLIKTSVPLIELQSVFETKLRGVSELLEPGFMA
jgi:hypothetical protein